MVKNFSVDWLAQSHHDSHPKGPVDTGTLDIIPNHFRPHVPCMVQPRQPTSYNKVHLQPKPKATRIELMDSITNCQKAESRLCSSVHPAICSSPSLSENSGYSSGYDSEATSSECPSVEEGSEEERDGAKRRARTRFTPEQIEKLERIFFKHKYPEAADRVKTALKLNLSETQVRTWFQNRRMKLKREAQDLRIECLVPVQPMLPFQSAYLQQHLHQMYRPVVPHIQMQQIVSPQHHHLMIPNAHYY
ncbi:ventral homeobox [Esox lucius]|uniref:Homeobox domain-containing protein n=1 Tax=Esox lucius TaxID=8010 RepID=A0A3P8YTX3_ESOLU|nr:ventral homeobox [Esox lucius]